MTFRVGQKVVCISSHDPLALHRNEVMPTVGMVLTIRYVWPSVSGEDKSPFFFEFEEIRNPKLYGGHHGEAVFASRRYRPVVERKTDISIFTEILDRTKSKEFVS